MPRSRSYLPLAHGNTHKLPKFITVRTWRPSVAASSCPTQASFIQALLLTVTRRLPMGAKLAVEFQSSAKQYNRARLLSSMCNGSWLHQVANKCEGSNSRRISHVADITPSPTTEQTGKPRSFPRGSIPKTSTTKLKLSKKGERTEARCPRC